MQKINWIQTTEVIWAPFVTICSIREKIRVMAVGGGFVCMQIRVIVNNQYDVDFIGCFHALSDAISLIMFVLREADGGGRGARNDSPLSILLSGPVQTYYKITFLYSFYYIVSVVKIVFSYSLYIAIASLSAD